MPHTMKSMSVRKHAEVVKAMRKNSKEERVNHAVESLQHMGFFLRLNEERCFWTLATVNSRNVGVLEPMSSLWGSKEVFRIRIIGEHTSKNTSKLWSSRLVKLWNERELFQTHDFYYPAAKKFPEPTDRKSFLAENQLLLLEDLFHEYKQSFLNSTTITVDTENLDFNSKLLPFFLVGDTTNIVDVALQQNLSADSVIITALRYNLIDYTQFEGLESLPHEWLQKIVSLPEDINRKIEHVSYSSYSYAKEPETSEPNQVAKISVL